MARADKNDLVKSRIDTERQQRREQPDVPGATGSKDKSSPKAAKTRARKLRGKTRKHVSEDTPVE